MKPTAQKSANARKPIFILIFLVKTKIPKTTPITPTKHSITRTQCEIMKAYNIPSI